jgi:hypothetical protein
MENVYEVSSFLLPDELEVIDEIIKDKRFKQEDATLGRILYNLPVPDKILENIQLRVEAVVSKKLSLINASFADYDSKYGQPNLPPHFDGDNNNLIVDYQYKSNTSWGLGVSSTVFQMEDNKAVMFNPNEYPHWRPRKKFNDGEYITMVFFRFPDYDGKIDYSHMRYSQNDEIFADIHKVRDSL